MIFSTRLILTHLIGISLLICSCNKISDSKENDIKAIISKANIIYTVDEMQSGNPYVPLYVANGIVGGCFDQMGFQSTPNTGYPEGRTVFGYIRNYDLVDHGRHIQFPLAIINAEFSDGSSILNLMDAKNYKQELDLYNGTLNTVYDLYGETSITSFAHQTIPNLFVMKIERVTDQKGKELVIKVSCETSKAQNNDTGEANKVDAINVQTKPGDGFIDIISKTDVTTTNWKIICKGASFSYDNNVVSIKLKEGENLLKFLIQREDCPAREVLNSSFEELFTSHTKEWAKIWNTSWIDLPDERMQDIWTRMKYYTICNFPVIPEKPMMPSGLNSNIWGFTFPQDVYFVAENLPRLGHFDRSEKAMKYWLETLPDVKAYGKRLMGVDGAYYPWTPPYQDYDNYEKDGVNGADSYELHNPAYVAAMVWHYYKINLDKDFLKEYFSIIEEVFRFYSNISQENEHGTYDIFHKNARGQDEASSIDGNLRNLLCASYSAEYTARNYLKACEINNEFDNDLKNLAEEILDKGYERNSLLRENGIYTTFEGDNRPFGSQKHPVQLNPITYVPMVDMVDENSAVEKAWNNRFELTLNAKKPITLGWTIGEFALSSVRMKSPENLKKDLSTIQICRGADPRWIQFYESSFWSGWHLSKSYYFPMMGLYLQAFTDIVIQDWRGYVDVFACILPEWKNQKFSFHGIRTINNVEVSGWWDNGKFEIILTPHSADIEIPFSVSQKEKNITATGQKKGPKEFQGNEIVKLSFNDTEPIYIRSK